MRPTYAILFSFLLLLTGCGERYGNHYNVGIDPNFTPEQTETALNTFDEWTRAVGVSLTFSYTVGDLCGRGDADGLICIHPTTYAENLVRANGVHAVGHTERRHYQDSSDIYIATDILAGNKDPGVLSKVMGHEIGHAMGLQHSNQDPPTIMCPSVGCSAETVQCVDVGQWAALRGGTLPCD